jgi:hypothetical protein
MLDSVFQGIQMLVVLALYSALISFLFPLAYDFVNEYTDRGKKRPLDEQLDFVNTYIIQSVFLLLFFITYALILKPLIYKNNY